MAREEVARSKSRQRDGDIGHQDVSTKTVGPSGYTLTQGFLMDDDIDGAVTWYSVGILGNSHRAWSGLITGLAHLTVSVFVAGSSVDNGRFLCADLSSLVCF